MSCGCSITTLSVSATDSSALEITLATYADRAVLLPFFCAAGGHSVNVTFNDVKSANIPLFCKDRPACEESLQMNAFRYCAGGDLHGTASSMLSSSATAVRPGTSVIALRGTGSGGKFRQATSPYLRSGNLHSALQGNTPSRGRNSKDSAKLKGINLNSQTMLKIADTDRIMSILHSLDSSTFSVLSGMSDGGSGLTSAAGSSADLESMRHQLRALSSSRLQALIEASDPTKSFLDISLLLDEPVEEVSIGFFWGTSTFLKSVVIFV
jgi:hypothetical protein